MKKISLFLTASLLISSPPVTGQDSALEAVLMGSRLLYAQKDTLFYMQVGEWQKKAIYSPCNAGNTVRWAATGKTVLLASSSAVTVVDVSTRETVFNKTGLSINYVNTADPAADISYDGKTVYFAQGNNIRAIDIATGAISTIFTTTSANQFTEGELCVSQSGKRFVGRKSNSYAAFVDIGFNSSGVQGQFAQECSPAISPSGTILAVNQDGHQNIETYNWPLDQAAPTVWRLINSSGKGLWDNHTWSNHEHYYVGNGDGSDCKIINVQTQDVYIFGHSTVCQYPDFWVPASAGGVVPASQAITIRQDKTGSASRSRNAALTTLARLDNSRIMIQPDISHVAIYSLSGQLLYDIPIAKQPYTRCITLSGRLDRTGLYLIKQTP